MIARTWLCCFATLYGPDLVGASPSGFWGVCARRDRDLGIGCNSAVRRRRHPNVLDQDQDSRSFDAPID